MNVIFFDGVCGLCNSFVDFLLIRDKKKDLRYSPLQGMYIEKTKAAALRSEETLVFLKGDRIYVRSSAAIEAVAMLGGVWKLFKVFLAVPRFFRDPLYNFVAKHRYDWFGKKKTCRIPSLKEKPYFLD